MTKHIFTCAVISALLISACNSVKPAETESDIPFIEAKNYFVKNTYQDEGGSGIKITSRAEFDTIFGMAVTMSEKSMPTAIDFSRQYVIGYIGQTTDKLTELAVHSLVKTGGEIVLTYNQTSGRKAVVYQPSPFYC